jgi:hypothetical protein
MSEPRARPSQMDGKYEDVGYFRNNGMSILEKMYPTLTANEYNSAPCSWVASPCHFQSQVEYHVGVASNSATRPSGYAMLFHKVDNSPSQ